MPLKRRSVCGTCCEREPRGTKKTEPILAPLPHMSPQASTVKFFLANCSTVRPWPLPTLL
eukprot:13100465-Alexandrium_andersonii.AAC.1